jgi:hypothetical protein
MRSAIAWSSVSYMRQRRPPAARAIGGGSARQRRTWSVERSSRTLSGRIGGMEPEGAEFKPLSTRKVAHFADAAMCTVIGVWLLEEGVPVHPVGWIWFVGGLCMLFIAIHSLWCLWRLARSG